ncbi:glycosyltransferase family 4 protein [Pectobacterium aquaticum]|uniref:glycosyltransferase family 4 protein n=1 Tax=Pectobacterium aquaticum TaxID=2204145 RepID=UPI000E27ED51|nr:glycosyltransferase family 4 protein [Pectobacterium aquaticum]RRN99957.1 glycosyltransferase family 1 protein [Pectobacterium aquaticum]
MKVLYIITKASEIGGAQVHVKDLSERLLKDGHSVEVIVGEYGILVDELLDVGVSVHVVSNLVREIAPKKDIACIFNLRKLINNIKPDIVALHSSKAGIVGRLAMLFKKTPVLFTAHGWAFADGVDNRDKKKYILIERIFSKIVDKIITVSHQDKNLALKYKVATEEKQIVIHNGIPEKKIIRGKSNNNFIVKIVSIARFSKQKDHTTLLKALKLLNRDDYHLDLLGTGPLLDEMKRMASELNLNDRVSFLGERRDIENILSQEDIFVLSSNWEGLPLSLLEAMREGLPIVASDVGGISECVKESFNGYLTKRGDPEDLADKITMLLDDKELRLRMGKIGREIFENDFNFDVMYEKTMVVYRNLIEAKL